jgi:hypothetical protein
MKSTKSISLVRMTNEVHVQFHQSAGTILNNVSPAALTADRLAELYRAAINSEAAALLVIKKSEVTGLIAEQDKRRDDIFRGFWDSVKGLRNHFDPEQRALANRLWSVLQQYGNLATKTQDAQTAATNALLRDLQQPALLQAHERLGLSSWCARLGEENQRFELLMQQRYTEEAGQATLSMRAARLETDRYYRALTAHADNLLLTDPTHPAATTFVAELNAVVQRFKSILAQQLSARKSEEEKE